MSATSWNAIGLAFAAVGFVQPLVVGELTWTHAAKVGDSRIEMENWDPYWVAMGGLGFFALLLWIDEQRLRREWKRGMEAEEAARRAAE